MNPAAEEIHQSLLGASKHVPTFLKQRSPRLRSAEERTRAQQYIKSFNDAAAEKWFFRDRGPHCAVKESILDALRGSSELVSKVGNDQLAKMLVAAHSHVAGFSSMMYLNVLVERDVSEAAAVAEQLQTVLKSIRGGKPDSTQLAATFTGAVVTLFEAQTSDSYAAALADHLLSAYANR